MVVQAHALVREEALLQHQLPLLQRQRAEVAERRLHARHIPALSGRGYALTVHVKGTVELAPLLVEGCEHLQDGRSPRPPNVSTTVHERIAEPLAER